MSYLEFGFVSFDGGAFEGSLWLPPFVLGFDVRVECGIGELSFSAAALEVPAFFVLARPSGVTLSSVLPFSSIYKL